MVPGGFERYARVFHPADDLRWADVAAMAGTVFHREAQWHLLMGDADVQEPYPGTLPVELMAPMVEALRAHTTTPERCWFAVWEGHGCSASWVLEAPAFEVPGRRMRLFAGTVDDIRRSFCTPPFHQSANLWWPDDQAWCVSTEIDFAWTYVGGPSACIDAVLARPELEAVEASPTDGITYDADRINATGA